MKIRNKFLIPMIALLLAIVMTGASVPGTAADTSAEESTSESTTHPLTYIPPSVPSTSSIDEEINKLVSDNLSDLGQYEDEVRGFGGVMDKILSAFSNFLGKIIEFANKIGEFFSNSNIKF